MRALLILFAALMLGATGGYAWSMLGSAPAPRPHLPRASMTAIAPSPEELPEEPDREWTERSDDAAQAVYYPGCNAVRAAGKAPLLAGQPGYRSEMDGDGDGVACEPVRG